MTVIADIKSLARQKLAHLYPEQEVQVLCRLLFETILHIDTTTYYLSMQHMLKKEQETYLLSALDRLQRGEPIQYILGKADFYGLELEVAPGVLIPRQETEELVQWVLEDFTGKACLDIGTGSGCMALALKNALGDQVRVEAMDIAPQAKRSVLRNAAHYGLDIAYVEADILSHPRFPQRYDVIVSNPPYVTESEKPLMQQHVLLHEPEMALFVADEDPLCFYRAIADFARDHLHKGGKLYVEINERFGKETREIMQRKGFSPLVLKQDMQGKDRMLMAVNR